MNLSSRRQFLLSSFSAGAGLVLAGCRDRGAVGDRLDLAEGKRVGTVPFEEPGRLPVGEVSGEGLGGRLALDLSTLTPGSLVVPNDRFYIRTRAPANLGEQEPWRLALRGLVAGPAELSLEDLARDAGPMGAHLLECSGNTPRRGFGLISAAEWSGVPVGRVLEKARVRRGTTRVLISGYDEHPRPSRGSVAGASWVFTFEDLEKASAFLATEMNGEPLSPDHGAPVRLVVPGWYGCCCIKWVNEIALVDEDVPSTSQMREFANRIHQEGVPLLAREFRPATMDLAAMPVRVEKWLTQGRVSYRVVGILWGGEKPTDRLMIRFNPAEKFTPVDSYAHETTTTWTLWEHPWRPAAVGRYRIELKVDDPKIPTRRLDLGYYAREVKIADV
jgi:DMSO/TMAO reductase YedYZ molybdopterin-dependent catalytic subunit